MYVFILNSCIAVSHFKSVNPLSMNGLSRFYQLNFYTLYLFLYSLNDFKKIIATVIAPGVNRPLLI